MRTSILVCSLITVVAAAAAIVAGVGAESPDPNLLAFENSSGQLRTFNRNGAIDLNNPFFQDLGTNGRRCVTCHQPDAAWTITPDNVRARFVATAGADPIFRSNDGSNCEGVDDIEGNRAAAYSLLRKFKGPILRGLAARAPYFHTGSAATLKDVVDFYNERFNMGLSTQEQADLIAFLRAL